MESSERASFINANLKKKTNKNVFYVHLYKNI